MTDPNAPDQPGGQVPPASQPGGQVPPAPQPTPGYPAPGAAPAYGQTAPAGAKTNTLAIVSLVASIAGIVLWGIGSLVGVICGHISLSQIKKTGEQGRGMALAGVIVGYIGLALAILGFIIFFIVLGVIASQGGFEYSY